MVQFSNWFESYPLRYSCANKQPRQGGSGSGKRRFGFRLGGLIWCIIPMSPADGQPVKRTHLQDVGGGCHPWHGSFSPSYLAIWPFLQRQKRGLGGCLRTFGHLSTVNSLWANYIRNWCVDFCDFSATAHGSSPKLVDYVLGTCKAPSHRRARGMAAGHLLPWTSSTRLVVYPYI
jgi:hypothetical protein